jgi:hypothetical protein
MSTIFDLKQQQQELLDSLYWIAEDNEEADVIKRHLLVIEGTIERKLSFLSDVLAESIALAQLATERRKIAAERLERKEAQAQRAELKLREFILSVMVDFDIKKVDGEIINISKYEMDSVITLPNMDIENLDERFIKTTKAVDKKLINEAIKAGEHIKGFELIKKDCIRIS